MGKKSILDIAILGFCAAIGILGYIYSKHDTVNYTVAAAAVCGSVMLIILIRDIVKERKDSGEQKSKIISRLLLLSEENTVLAEWDLFGRISMVIGKDVGRHTVDVNLNQTKYAGMIEHEHAVLNYCDEDWYIEDVGSQNGIRIQKAADGRKYDLTSGQPCKIDIGDIIYIGVTRLAVQ